jgi:predicted RNase H-like nuclease
MAVIAGVDLAWQGNRNPTAIAVGNVADGAIAVTGVFENLHGFDAVASALDSIDRLHGVAIDGPLIIRNQSGQRPCERGVAVAYGARKASCHACNLTLFPASNGVLLGDHLHAAGFGHVAAPGQKWQLECYPHPALIEIFQLPERLFYKKGQVADKRQGQARLASLLLSLAQSERMMLTIGPLFLPYLDPQRIQSLRGAALKHNEDVLDAIVCLYIAALYQAGNSERVFGCTEQGYIYVPQGAC